MNSHLLAGAGFCLLAGTFLASAQLSAVSGGTPKIQFTSKVCDFGRVSAGEIVRTDFVFTNAGNQTLEIKEVRPTCGCTTVGTWEHQIAPGKGGVIPLQLNTANYNGSLVKYVKVTCNDPAQPFINLQINGVTWKAIEVTPTFVIFKIAPDAYSNEVRTVKIVSNLKEPLELATPQVNSPSFIAKIVAVQPGRKFDLKITPVTPLPAGNVHATITIKTSATNLPVINITALALIRSPVATQLGHAVATDSATAKPGTNVPNPQLSPPVPAP